MITDTLLLYSTSVIALFDSGSTHIFIAKTFINRIGVPINDLGYNLVVSTPTRAVLSMEVCVRGVAVDIRFGIKLTNFTVLLMREFNAIFGMD